MPDPNNNIYQPSEHEKEAMKDLKSKIAEHPMHKMLEDLTNQLVDSANKHADLHPVKVFDNREWETS